MVDIHELFNKLCRKVALIVGSPWAFTGGMATILVWAITGPIFGYSDTWQLIINTGTTILTFLMVFLLQHTQNRDTLTMQIKLAELIRAVKRARLDMMDLEDLSDKELKVLHKEVEQATAKARARSKARAARKSK